MRLVFVRHCEPNYTIDSLTEKGFREAQLLSERLKDWKVEQFYVSPLGRARDTARPTLGKLHQSAITYDWMQEFTYRIEDPTTGRIHVPWDYMPEYWTRQQEFYDPEAWLSHPAFLENPRIVPGFHRVCRGIDGILARYGYTRTERFYKVDPVLTADDDDKTIVFFCHLGISLVMIAHILGFAPVQLQQSIYLPPSSVTILNAEKVVHDNAAFRAQVIGDTSHLRIGGEPISAMGAFSRVSSL